MQTMDRKQGSDALKAQIDQLQVEANISRTVVSQAAKE